MPSPRTFAFRFPYSEPTGSHYLGTHLCVRVLTHAETHTVPAQPLGALAQDPAAFMHVTFVSPFLSKLRRWPEPGASFPFLDL